MYKIVEQKEEKVSVDELRLYLTTIELDFKPSNNKQRISLLKQYFEVIITEKEFEEFEIGEYYSQKFNEDCFFGEDFELENRKHEYFLKLKQ
jgi:hypothetical protein